MRKALASSLLLLLFIIMQFVTVPTSTIYKPLYEGYSSAQMIVPAVSFDGQKITGVTSKLVVRVAWPGNGTVYLITDPLAELDMQASARLAAVVASIIAGVDFFSYDYFIEIKSNTTIIGGPSASGAVTVALVAALRGKTISNKFSMTGTVSPDFSLGPVGGIPQKLEAVSRKGIKIFVVPQSQLRTVDLETKKEVNITKLGERYGVNVVGATSLVEAYTLATNDTILEYEEAGTQRMVEKTYPLWLKEEMINIISMLRNSALSNLTCALENQKLMSDKEKRLLSPYLDDINETLKEAEQAEREENFYTAASRYFYAAFMSTYTCLLSKVLTSDKPKTELLRIVDDYIERTSLILDRLNVSFTKISNEYITASELQALIASIIRFREAEEKLNALKQARGEIERAFIDIELVEDVLLSTTYTFYRSITSVQWFEISKKASTITGEENITIDRLSFAVRLLAYHAYSTLTYLESIGIPLDRQVYRNIEHIQLLLSTSRRDISDVLYALALSVESISQMSSRVYALFSSPELALNTSSKSFSFLYCKVLERNITPLLPTLYKEFANYTHNPISAVQLYTKASTYALLLLLSSEAQVTKPRITKTTGETASVTTNITTVTSTIKEIITTTKTLVSNTTIEKTRTIIKTTSAETTVPPASQIVAYILISVLAFLAGVVFSRRG